MSVNMGGGDLGDRPDLTSPLLISKLQAWWGAVMLIDLPKEHDVFEPEAIEAMGEAFEAALKDLHDASPPEGVRELIARRIIAYASKGELDPVRLRAAALSGLRVAKMSPAA